MKYLTLTPLLILASCAQLESTAAKVKTFSTSPTGEALLTAVQIAANVFEPQYAGIIGQGINSLQTGTLPTAAQAQTELAAVTGKSATDQKVVALATAVIAAAQQAPTPAVGLQAAANVVSPPAK